MIKRSDTIADAQTDAAADWLMRRAAGPLTPVEAEAFDAWLSESPDHRRAYEEVEWIWGATAAVEGQPRIEAHRRRVLQSVGRAQPARRAMAAALVAAVVGAGGFGWQALSGPKPLATQSFRTAVGQQATVTLPDDSAVGLNPGSGVRTKAEGDRGRGCRGGWSRRGLPSRRR